MAKTLLDIGVKAAGMLARAALDRGVSRDAALAEASVALAEFSEADFSDVAPVIGLPWLEHGFPCVEVSAKLAASLMCTGLSPDLIPDVRMPWGSFSIRIPENIVGCVEVIVSAAGESVFLLRETQSGFSLSSVNSLRVFCNLPEKAIPEFDGIEVSAEQWSQERLLGRLIIGVCIEMMRHRPTPENEAYGKRTVKPGREGPPVSWTFRLTRPVNLDVRPAIKEWLGGERGGKLTLQHMVRGHHKMQPCGPGLLERKWITIEPYWRGDVDAPIALRQHQLGEK